MNNSFIGFDLSYLHSGISIINSLTKEIYLKEFGIDINKKSTPSIFNSIPIINNELIKYLDLHSTLNRFSGIEITRAMTSWMVSELYALDYDMFSRLTKSNYNNSINLYSNASLSKSLLGHKSSEKEKTILLVEDKILPIFEKHGYKLNKESITSTKVEKDEKGRWTYKDTITDGCADSMIYALRQFILYSEDEQLKQDILEVLPGLSNMKEME